MGTEVSIRYGERTGERLLTDASEGGYKTQLNVPPELILTTASSVVEMQVPLFLSAKRLTVSQLEMQIKLLIIPVCNESETVNMLFGHIEVKQKVMIAE